MAQTVSFNKRVPPGAAGGGTLAALMKRQQDAADAKNAAMQMPGPLASPWQGAAHIGNIVSAGIGEGRAEAQEGQARAELAKLMSGYDPAKSGSDFFAQVGMYDEGLRDRLMEEASAARRAAEERTFQTGERVAGQDFQITKLGKEDEIADVNRGEEDAIGDENAVRDAKIKAEQDKEAARVDLIQSRQDAALKSPYAELEQERIGTNMPEEEFLRRKQLIDDKAAADIANAAPAKFGAVPPEVAAARGGDIAKHPERYEYDAKTGAINPVSPARSAQELKVAGDFEKGLIESRSTLTNLQKALELAPNIFEGSGVMGVGGAQQRADVIMKTPSAYPPELVKQATDTQAYFNIMNEQAIKAMGGTLAGATTEFEMQRFMAIMANEAIPLKTKQEEISRMMEKVRLYEKSQTQQVLESGGDPTFGAGTAPAEPAPEAPAPAPEQAAPGEDPAAARKKKYGLK